MNVSKRTLAVIAGALWVLGGVIAPAAAQNLPGQVESMMADFQPIIGSGTGEKPVLIAVGSFFDPATWTSEALGRDVEAEVFNQVMSAFAGSRRAVIAEWKRTAPLVLEGGETAGTVRYRLSDSVRRFSQVHGGGFLITGFADAPNGELILRAELVAVPEGTVAARFGPPPPVQAILPSASDAAGKPSAKEASAAARAAESAEPTPASSRAPEAPAPSPVADDVSTAAGDVSPAAESVALATTVIEGKNFRYEGQVNAEGQKQGHGILIFATGDTYTGQWRNDRMNGEGTYEFADGDKYVGQWRDGKMNGRGTYTYANGDRYIGLFADDVKDGPGTYQFENGDRWEGRYLKGRKHGKAEYIWANGQRKQELWNDGQRVE
jgi:hypothetical protein